MNQRLSLTEIATSIAGQLGSGVKVGTIYDADYLTTYGKAPYPQVWVGGQRNNRVDDGSGYSERFRQKLRIDIALRLIMARYVNGATTTEVNVNTFADQVANAIIATVPTGAEQPFFWNGSQDGPTSETLIVIDQVFTTYTTYQR